MSKFYCVFKAPVELAKYGGMDHMVNGGIYTSLDYAKEKAKTLVQSLFSVWIEEYEGNIDVLTKENMVQVHYI